MEKLKIEYLPLDSLQTYVGNAKLHPAEQIEQIKESIEKFGFNDPIAVWGEENTIVEGHGRYIAAQELGIYKVPVIRLDSLSDSQRRAYMLVHNKLTMNSGFDFDTLQAELDQLSDEDLDFDMKDFGFDEGDNNYSYLDNLIDEGFTGEKVETDEFSITFVFPIEEKEVIENYITEHSDGKKRIVDEIIKFVKGKDNA